jgi:molybdate transport system regulatory protein
VNLRVKQPPRAQRTTRPNLRVSSALTLETRLGGIANPRWMDLLAGLEHSRSITAAAKSAGLSYKAAWDAIDAMNNVAGKAIVATSIGGKGGGGARLTTHGRELLSTYRTIEAENQRFVANLNERLYHAHGSVRALRRMSMRTTARNQWSGVVHRVTRGAVNDEVEIKLASGDHVTAIVTHESAENLGLDVGSEAVALLKASSVMVGKGRARLKLSARNQLTGTIARVMRGAVNSEIVIGLRRGYTVAAIITNASAKELKLAEGQKAWAIFKASSLIVATA